MCNRTYINSRIDVNSYCTDFRKCLKRIVAASYIQQTNLSTKRKISVGHINIKWHTV